MNDFSSAFDKYFATDLIQGPGPESWPICTYIYIIFSESKVDDCIKYFILVDWLTWITQTAHEMNFEEKNYITLPQDAIKRKLLTELVGITCGGEHVSSLYGCVSNGTICSQHGSCSNGKCQCDAEWKGATCDSPVADSSSSNLLAILLGVLLPSGAIILCLILVGIVIVVIVQRRKRQQHEDWMIDYSQIEFGEQLGTGGFGEVRKGMWRGTEVAVKTIAAGSTMSHETRNKFVDEVRIMTALRHPNIVLFMGASTKLPHMCIVMEYMALGSLYDVLHNELISEIPHELKIKMARQAARGMHFLHSAGINGSASAMWYLFVFTYICSLK